jgi:hypothetical protein
MARYAFDATSVAPQQSLSPIPAGTYVASIIESDVKTTKENTGQYIQAVFQVLDGQFAGRKVFGRINVRNQNAQAEQIGQAQLSALQHAVGVLRMDDTQQLHGRPVQIRVKVRKDDSGRYEDSNEITGYAAAPAGTTLPPAPAGQRPGFVAPPAPAAAAPAMPPPAPAPAAPPWAARR